MFNDDLAKLYRRRQPMTVTRFLWALTVILAIFFVYAWAICRDGEDVPQINNPVTWGQK